MAVVKGFNFGQCICTKRHKTRFLPPKSAAEGPSSHPSSTGVAGGVPPRCGLGYLKVHQVIRNEKRRQNLLILTSNDLRFVQMLSQPSTAMRAMLSKSQSSWTQRSYVIFCIRKTQMSLKCRLSETFGIFKLSLVLLATSHRLEETDNLLKPVGKQAILSDSNHQSSSWIEWPNSGNGKTKSMSTS